MSTNIMNEYIQLTQKQVEEYIKLIFENKFDKKIFNQYLSAYVYARYNNSVQVNKTLRTRILEALEQEKQNAELLYNEKKDLCDEMCDAFSYIMYLDEVVLNKNMENLAEELKQKKEIILGKKDEEFKQKLTQLITEFSKERQKFFVKYESKDFLLKISNYKMNSELQRVNIKYNFKLPILYSQFAIDKAFNMAVINEDKLFIEYILISLKVIKEVIRGNYKKQYIVEYADTLLDKKQKNERLLNIINNDATKDKINLKIKYEVFTKHKEEIYEIIKKGFKIAIILDDTFEENYENVQKLELFSYILVDSKLESYSIIPNDKKIENKIVRI